MQWIEVSLDYIYLFEAFSHNSHKPHLVLLHTKLPSLKMSLTNTDITNISFSTLLQRKSASKLYSSKTSDCRIYDEFEKG